MATTRLSCVATTHAPTPPPPPPPYLLNHSLTHSFVLQNHDHRFLRTPASSPIVHQLVFAETPLGSYGSVEQVTPKISPLFHVAVIIDMLCRLIPVYGYGCIAQIGQVSFCWRLRVAPHISDQPPVPLQHSILQCIFSRTSHSQAIRIERWGLNISRL